MIEVEIQKSKTPENAAVFMAFVHCASRPQFPFYIQPVPCRQAADQLGINHAESPLWKDGGPLNALFLLIGQDGYVAPDSLPRPSWPIQRICGEFFADEKRGQKECESKDF